MSQEKFEPRIDCPRCFGTGLQAPRVLSGPIAADAVKPCQLCLEAARKKANDGR